MKFSLFCLSALCCLSAQAEQPAIAYVKTVSGEAFVSHGQQRQKAEPGTAIQTGAKLQTGAQGSLGVTFKDETVMSFGPNTELTVDEYLYNPTQGKLKLGTRMTRGSMNYVSGVIAKLQPDAVSVATPTGTIGVRGTQFLVKVEE